MFIRFFKTNQPASLIALPLFGALLWLGSWLKPQPAEAFLAMPLYFLFAYLSVIPFFSVFMAFALVIIQSFYFNRLINEYDLRGARVRANFLPALFAVFFLSLFPVFRTSLPQHFSAILLLLALNSVFDSYRKEKAFANCFNSGMLVAFASLFYFPAVVFLLLVFTGYVVLRPFIWREWVITLIGFVLPWLVTVELYYVFNNTLNIFSGFFSAEYFHYGKPQNAVLIYIFAGLLLLPALLHFAGSLSSGKVRTNKFLLLFLCFFVFALVSGFVFPVGSYAHFTLAAMPLALIFSNYFLSFKKEWIAEAFFAILLGAFIYAEIRNLF